MRKVWMIAVGISLLLGILLFWPVEQQAPAQNAPLQKYVAAEGRIAVKPDQRAVLAAEVPGRIEEILVDNLVPVKKGQILAVLSNTDVQERIHQTEASYARAAAYYAEMSNGSRSEDIQEAEADLRKAQADLDVARSDEERDRKLAEEGVIARSRYDHTLAELRGTESQVQAARERYLRVLKGPRVEAVDAARADMAAQKFALESLKAAYEKTFIRSPLDGIVIHRYRNVSEFADSGDPILEVANLSEVIVEVEVNETDAGKVEQEQKAIVTSDAFPGQTFAAQTYEVSAALRKRSSDPEDPAVVVDQKILPVKVRFLQPVPLKLGMKVDLKIYR